MAGMETPDPKVLAFHARAVEALGELCDRFLVGVHATLILRVPEYPDHSRDVLVSDDDPETAIEAIRACAAMPVVSTHG